MNLDELERKWQLSKIDYPEIKNLIQAVRELAEALRKIGYMETGEKIIGTSRNMAVKNFEEQCRIAREILLKWGLK